MDLSKVKSGDKIPQEINVVIEIGQNSAPVKYEFQEDSALFFVNRFLPTSMYYPCNYGFIPHTQGGDGDPVDVLVVTRFPVLTGAVICSKPVGVLIMDDECGEDVKILAVPVTKVDPYYSHINNYSDFQKAFLDNIVHFFTYYKQLEKDKFVNVKGWKSVEEAEKIIIKSLMQQ